LIFSGEQLIAVADLWLDHSVQATSAARNRGRLFWRSGNPLPMSPVCVMW